MKVTIIFNIRKVWDFLFGFVFREVKRSIFEERLRIDTLKCIAK